MNFWIFFVRTRTADWKMSITLTRCWAQCLTDTDGSRSSLFMRGGMPLRSARSDLFCDLDSKYLKCKVVLRGLRSTES